MTLPFLFQDQRLAVQRTEESKHVWTCSYSTIWTFYSCNYHVNCTDIRPKKSNCTLCREIVHLEKIVTNICDLFLLWRNIQTWWINSRQDAKTIEIVHLVTGHTRRIILHTSTVTCLDRDSSPYTRFMYRPSYVRQLWDFEISLWLLKLLVQDYLLLLCSQIPLERSIDERQTR